MRLTVHVQPNAKQNEIVSWLDEDTLKVKLAAPAKEGRANRELVAFLSEELGMPRSQIEIVRGLTAKMKQVEVPERRLWKTNKKIPILNY